ncbi:MAG: MATE family efflux transporter [Acidimicrobiia bacterium]|nr:MATE family efflux transporter [Acidimicrobiia bacterium]
MKGRELDREIFRLAIPALGTLAADPIVSLVDTAFVGQLGKTPLGALGVSVAVFSVAFFLFNFLAYGTTPLIAGAVARDDRREAGRLTMGALALGVVIGVGALVLLELLAEPILRIMGADAGLLSEATLYLRIRVLGLPAVLLATVAHGVFRGYQDTKTPMWVTGSISVFNLILDPILIFGLDWGLAGAAWATMIAQWLGALIFVSLFWQRRIEFSLRWERPRRDVLQPLLGAGRALVIRSGALLGAFTLATAVATRQGDEVVAAHQVAMQLWIFLALVVDALAIAAQALIGLHFASARDLARAYGRRLLAWGTVGGLVLAGVMAAGASSLPGVFSNDPDVVAQVESVYPFIVAMQPLNAIVFVWDGIVIGASRFGFLAATTVLAAAATAVVLAGVQLGDWGLPGVWWALVAMMVVRFATLAWWHVSGPLGGRDPSPASRATA